MKCLRSKLTYANVMVTVLAFVVLAGGTAFAATQMLPKNSVGAKQLKKHAVTPAKLSSASSAALAGPAGRTGATGAQGPVGAQGPKGDQGEPATSLLAHVSASGKIIGGSGVTGTVPLEKAYGVDFDRDVSDCNYQVTLASLGSSGFAITEPLEGDSEGVVIEILDKAGSHASRAFYLAVLCP